jgi:hypothetical protein
MKVLFDAAFTDRVAALQKHRLGHELHTGEAAEDGSEAFDEEAQLAEVLLDHVEEDPGSEHLVVVF